MAVTSLRRPAIFSKRRATAPTGPWCSPVPTIATCPRKPTRAGSSRWSCPLPTETATARPARSRQEPSNSPPVILGETDPAQQTIVLAELPTVLTQGSTTNVLGLPTENFDGMSAGSPSDNGHGHGNFFSDALDATFTASGNAGVTAGTSSSTAAPFIGPLPGHVDDSQYLSVGGGATETISFADKQNA